LRFAAPAPGRTIGLAWRRTSPRKVDFDALGQIVLEALGAASKKKRASQRRRQRARLVTYSKNNCPQCSEWLLAPDWSEYLDECCVRHTWSCDACGYEFKTSVLFSTAA
jgi:hypothetical protein